MDRERLYNVMEDKQAMDALPIVELQQLVLRFPYFQAARILLLKKLKEEENIAFDRELKKSSVFVGDRAKLYVYLHAQNVAFSRENVLPELSLITTSGERVSDVSASYSINVDSAFNYLFLSEEEAQTVNQQEVLKSESELVGQHSESGRDWSLIDKFMDGGSNRIIVEPDDENVPKGNLAESSAQENPTILTETLAKIYIKQKKYDKAISIFRSLSLKFPNKSAYFATRIEELKILTKSS